MADITPDIGTTLSGFISRQNRPSVRVEDSLEVRVLAMRQNREVQFLVSCDLLGISASLEQQILAALEGRLGTDFSRDRCVIVATHTHSAPPTSPLEGEADPDPHYWRLLCDQVVKAAQEAIRRLMPASMHIASIRIPGLTYNRRAVLADGRVSMALDPEAPVLERGPVDDTLTVLVWRDEQDRVLAIGLHSACHGVAVCEQSIGSDIPGNLARRIGEMFGGPCLYLQGAAGDVNPVTVAGSRPAMLAWVERCMDHLQSLSQALRPVPCTPHRAVSVEVPLAYKALPQRSGTERNIVNLDRIAQADVTSPDVQDTLHLLAGIMNFGPGERPDLDKAAFAARALANAERRTLAAGETGEPLPFCPLRVSLWRVGWVTLAFVAAEIFAVTGLRIRSLGKGQTILPVACASPIIGYVPDRAAMEKGGYEVEDAWRFYRQPAPFAPDSEERLMKTIETLAARV